MGQIQQARESLDSKWEKIRQFLKQPNHIKIIASLLAHVSLAFPKEGIPFTQNGYAIHTALLRLKKKKEQYGLILRDFVFSRKGPYPVAKKLNDAFSHLLLTQLIRIPNPDFDKIIVTEEMRQRIFAKEKEWFPGPARQELIAVMAKDYANLIVQKEEELARREAPIVC